MTTPTKSSVSRKHFAPRSSSKELHEYRSQVLVSLGKLDVKESKKTGSEELRSYIDGLNTDTISIFLNCMLDTFKKASGLTRNDYVKLFAVCASIHGDMVAPFLPKIMIVISKLLKDGDGSNRDTCAEAIGILGKSIPSAADAQSDTTLSVFLLPLFELLADQNKMTQQGAAVALQKLLEHTDREAVTKVSPSLFARSARLLSSATFHASAALLDALQILIKITGELAVSAVPALMALLLEKLSASDWTTRRAAADLLYVLATRLGNAMSSYREEVLRLLSEARFDRVGLVRDAVTRAHQAFSDIGASFSPTRIELQATGPAATLAVAPPASNTSPAISSAPATPLKPKTKQFQSPDTHSVSTSDSNHLQELTATLLTLSAQFQEFRDDVVAKLSNLDSRLRTVEEKLNTHANSSS